MNCDFLKNWILEIAGLIAAILLICGSVKKFVKFSFNFTQKIIEFLKFCYCEFKKNIPFVLKRDYRSLENNMLILQNELVKKDNQLEVEEDSVRSLKKINYELSKKLADSERTVWKDGVLYHNDLEICSRCYDTSLSADRKIVRLFISDHETKGIFYCPECKTRHKTEEGARQEINKHREAVRQISGRRY
jgi:hypothetical protein